MIASADAGPAACRVSLANRQRRIAVRTDRLRRLAARVLRAARPLGGELSVLLVDDAAIAELNAAYRGRPRPTDVLSFSQLEGPSPPTAPPGRSPGAARAERGALPCQSAPSSLRLDGGPARRRPGPPRMIGDVVISVETARRQARERGRPLEEEMAALLIHGVLHLLGHDHERGGAPARRMFAREREVAAAIGLPALALGDRPAGRGGHARRGGTR